MQQLLGPDTFEFLARYFLAGWVFLSARSWWVAGERPKPNEVIFEAVLLSLINQVLSLATIPLLLFAGMQQSSTPLLVVEVIAQPAGLGMLVGWLASINSIPSGFRRLVLPAVKPVGNALSYAFDMTDAPSFVILTFSDGRVIYGFFGEISQIQTEDMSGGIYLESIYSVDEDGTWIEVDPPRGAWITLEGLTSLELIPRKEDG